MKRAMKAFTLVNFGVCLGGLIWLACNRGEGNSPSPVTPSNKSVAKTGTPPLATLDAIINCLEGEGGLSSDGTCVSKARVDGLEPKATLNDHYFAASKAAVPVTVSYRQRVGDFVHSTLATACNAGETTNKPMPQQMPQQTQQAAPMPPPPSDQQLACLRTELARRTHAHE